MQLRDALLQLAGDTQMNAVRPCGRGIKVNARNCIQTVGPRGLYRWQPGFSDMIATDWEVVSDQALMIRFAEMQRQAAAAAAEGN